MEFSEIIPRILPQRLVAGNIRGAYPKQSKCGELTRRPEADTATFEVRTGANIDTPGKHTLLWLLAGLQPNRQRAFAGNGKAGSWAMSSA